MENFVWFSFSASFLGWLYKKCPKYLKYARVFKMSYIPYGNCHTLPIPDRRINYYKLIKTHFYIL